VALLLLMGLVVAATWFVVQMMRRGAPATGDNGGLATAGVRG
jgi:flagellar biogenesis protein FliO